MMPDTHSHDRSFPTVPGSEQWNEIRGQQRFQKGSGLEGNLACEKEESAVQKGGKCVENRKRLRNQLID